MLLSHWDIIPGLYGSDTVNTSWVVCALTPLLHVTAVVSLFKPEQGPLMLQNHFIKRAISDMH